jgi:glycolate oxidase FAD binding subunit
LAGLGGVIDYPYADMTITVESGMTLDSIQSVLAREGQRLALEAPCPARATLGGIYATNAFGPRAFGWGRPRDMVIGIEFVDGEGRRIHGGGRVVKNVAGYDFPKLLTGSMGELGVITTLTLRVRPKAECVGALVASADRLELVSGWLERLNTSETRPIVVWVGDRSATAGVGEDWRGEWSVVCGYEGFEEAVGASLRGGVDEFVGATEVRTMGGDAAAALLDGLVSVMEPQAAELDCVRWRAWMRPSSIVPFLGLVDSADWMASASAALGIVDLAWRGGMENFGADGGGFSRMSELRAGVEAAGGRTAVVRCPASWKERVGVWGGRRADWGLMERLKTALDPIGVLNPGRFVPSI